MYDFSFLIVAIMNNNTSSTLVTPKTSASAESPKTPKFPKLVEDILKTPTEIDNKLRENPDVVPSREDLMFLYEICKDPRIEKIRKERFEKDLLYIFD
jgi:hypothetical protein